MQATARNDKVRAQALKARGQARQQAGKAVAQVGPLASSAKVTARKGVHNVRAWAAPRLESSGQTLESRVAPKLSAMMSSAAKRIDPGGHKRRRWPFVLAGLAALAAAAGAIFSRRAAAAPWRNADSQEESATTDTQPETSTSANGSAKSKVRTS
jgi:hypothetical protein